MAKILMDPSPIYCAIITKFHSFSGGEPKKQTEEKAKVVAAVWGTYLNATLAIPQQVWFEDKFLDEHPFLVGGSLV